MSRTINKLPNAHVEVICPVDEKTWKEAQEAAFKKLAANIQIPGFRKGKAPENMVRSKVNPGQVFDEAINAVLPKLYKAIVEEDKIDELRRAGANEFLAKPFETEKLIDTICRLLEIESFV